MSNETLVTLQGWIGGEVTLRRAGDVPVASFRVGCTPRRWHRRSETWVDAETQWYTVSAWRALAENCAGSLDKGHPVVVHGRLSARTWVGKDGVEVTTHEVEAVLVGHDLARGTTRFSRTNRPAAVAEPHTPAQSGDDAAA